jgi:hypothetical protein
MPKRKTNLRVPFWNTPNLPEGPELEKIVQQCNDDAERVLLLFMLKKEMTVWEAFHSYNELFGGNIQKVAVGARIKGLCESGYLYKTNRQVIEERGVLNYIFKLWPQEEVDLPEDYNTDSLEKIHQVVYFTNTGTVDLEKTRQEFETKLQNIYNKYK